MMEAPRPHARPTAAHTQGVVALRFRDLLHDGVPRLVDIELGQALGIRRPRDVRRLVRRWGSDLGLVPSRVTVARQRTGFGERSFEVTEYLLTEEQCLLLAANSPARFASRVLAFLLARRRTAQAGWAKPAPASSGLLEVLRRVGPITLRDLLLELRQDPDNVGHRERVSQTLQRLRVRGLVVRRERKQWAIAPVFHSPPTPSVDRIPYAHFAEEIEP